MSRLGEVATGLNQILATDIGQVLKDLYWPLQRQGTPGVNGLEKGKPALASLGADGHLIEDLQELIAIDDFPLELLDYVVLVLVVGLELDQPIEVIRAFDVVGNQFLDDVSVLDILNQQGGQDFPVAAVRRAVEHLDGLAQLEHLGVEKVAHVPIRLGCQIVVLDDLSPFDHVDQVNYMEGVLVEPVLSPECLLLQG